MPNKQESRTGEVEGEIILTVCPFVSEHHFQIGDKLNFEKALANLGVQKSEDKMWDWKGIKIFESSRIPKNKACLVDKVGNILQVYTI